MRHQETIDNLKEQLRSANTMTRRLKDDSADLRQQLREMHQQEQEYHEQIQQLQQAPAPAAPAPEPELCGICMSEYDDDTKLPMVGTCGHKYCRVCLVSG